MSTSEDPRDQKPYWFRMTPLRRVVTFVLRAVFQLFTTSQVEGVENLPRRAGVIVAANHLTNYDVFLLQFALPRPVFYMGKAELFQNPIMDWVFRQLGSFPVYRGERDEWAIRHAERVLGHGQVLGMFPEGTRSRGRGLRTAKTGVARLAQTCKCPIVPVAIHGPQYMFRRRLRRTRISITIGQPLYPQPGETTLNLTDRMMFALAEMLPPESRGAYRYRPPGF